MTEGTAAPTQMAPAAEWVVAAVYIAVFVPLAVVAAAPAAGTDFGFWHPEQALSVALLMILGPRHFPAVFLAMLLADYAVGGPHDVFASVTAAAAGAGGYALAAKVLREEVDFDARLSRLRDVLVFLVVIVAVAMAVTALQAALRASAGLMPWELFTAAAFRAWAGDVIGILALAPALLVHRGDLSRPRRWAALLRPEPLGTLAVIASGTWLLFGPLIDSAFKAFYLLFLPLIWAAVRHGLRGASLAVVVSQGALHVAVLGHGGGASARADIQLLMLALTVTNLVLGAVVSERRRAEAWLRAHQTELAHASRLSATGEMATTLAHELNQPLTATITYVRACQMGLRRADGDPELIALMDKAVAQAERASAVVRGLRAFLRKDEAPRSPVEPRVLVHDALALTGAEAAEHRVTLRVRIADDLPRVRVDAIQIQQVLVNLVRNSIEAVTSGRDERRLVRVGVRGSAHGIEFTVVDNGPGLAPEVAERLFTPFTTTKSSGMGLGLAIARSIVETHGGRLWAETNQPGGAVFRFTLPAHEETDDG